MNQGIDMAINNKMLLEADDKIIVKPDEVKVKKPRIHELELIRAIAYIATIFRHSLAGFIYVGNMNLFTAVTTCSLLSLVRFGTPTFLFVTGFVLLYNYETLNYWVFLKKRFTKVIIPYVLWSVVYFAFLKILSRVDTTRLEDISTILSQIIHGSASYHLWFIIMILQFYILFPVFRSIVKRFKGGKKWIGLLAGTFLYQIVVLWIYTKYLPGLTETVADGTLLKELLVYRDRNFLLWILYFMLGAIFAMNYEQIKGIINKYSKLIGLGAVLSLAYIIYVSLDRAVVENGIVTVNYMLTSPVYLRMMSYSVFAILSIFLICSKIVSAGGPLYTFLKWVGKLSFGGYLVHAIYVTIFVRIINHFLHGQPMLLCIGLTIICTFVFSTLTAYILSKLKLGKYIIGA